MTPSQQRIAIAEACGWMRYFEPLEINEDGVGKWRYHKGNSNVKWSNLPDYLNDLNAMHEAEKVLFDGEHDKEFFLYVEALEQITLKSKKPVWCAVFATATQRAEAFLRTLSLWQETEKGVTR
jgi:hypothetical protein